MDAGAVVVCRAASGGTGCRLWLPVIAMITAPATMNARTVVAPDARSVRIGAIRNRLRFRGRAAEVTVAVRA